MTDDVLAIGLVYSCEYFYRSIDAHSIIACLALFACCQAVGLVKFDFFNYLPLPSTVYRLPYRLLEISIISINYTLSNLIMRKLYNI